jgi:hypothetical protein
MKHDVTEAVSVSVFREGKTPILVELADRTISMAHQSRRFPCLNTETELTYRNVALHKNYAINKIPPPHPKKAKIMSVRHTPSSEQQQK